MRAGGLFVLIGSVPRTSWLPDTVSVTRPVFCAPAPDVTDAAGSAGPGAIWRWKPACRGIFAIGDVRAGSIKRVATAVGDGATVVSMLHTYLAENPVGSADRPRPRHGRPDAGDPVRRRGPGVPRGLQLTVFPLRTADWFAWTIDVPMTAVFLGAAYWSSAVLEIAGARSPGWGRARLTVWTVLVFTTLTLVVTLVHLDTFHLGPDHPRAPGSSPGAGWRSTQACRRDARRARHPGDLTASPRRARRCAPLPSGLRALLVVLAVVLLAPAWRCSPCRLRRPGAWPWPLTDLTARAIGAWLVGLGWAAAHARLIDDVDRVQPLGQTGVVFVVLEAIALLRYGDALDWSGRPAVVFVLVLGGIGAAGAWILLLGRAGRRTGQGLRAGDAVARGRTR